MNRRLNPDLFGPQGAPNETPDANYSAVASRKMEEELRETKKRVSHLESLLEVVQSQMSVMSNNNEQRTEAFSKALSELEKDFRESNLTQTRHMQHFEERFCDQKVKDGQMENMVDRFNTNLLQFENKVSTLQKVLSEKEMTLMSYRRIIEQIVDEVEKLKNKPNQVAPSQFI